MTTGLVLPTPPGSPSPSPRKPVVNPVASAVALPTTLPSTPVKDAQALSQPRSTSVANATSTTNTRATPQNTIAKPPAARSPSRTLAALKKDLHINDWRCGAQTRMNTECKHYIKDDKKNLIDTQLALMTGLTRASPDLEVAMLKLIMLVHCYQHDAGQPKERRLEAWRLIFPPGSANDSVPETSAERLIRMALEPFSVKCIAYSNGWACEKSIGGRKVQNCEKTVQKLIKQETYSDDGLLEFFLKVLEFNRTCNTHQSSKQFTWLSAWKKNLMAVLTLPMPLGGQALTSNKPNKPQTSPRAQADPIVGQVLPSPRASPGPTISPDADPASYWPEGYDSSPFEILAHANHNANLTRSHELIRAKINRPLDAVELNNGYVYSYEVEGNKGYVKIGYTTQSVAERHYKWSFDCNRQTKPLYPAPAQTATTISSAKEDSMIPAALVTHARRVEALCHAELDHRRIRIYCSACRKQHLEWFEVSAVEVTAVIQKWSKWMATQPYELQQLRGRSKWTLKASEVQRTRRFEKFMQEIALVTAPL